MRIPIREQLALLVLITCLVALAIVSIATWTNSYSFVFDIKSQGLSLTASFRAAQIIADLKILQSNCGAIVTRVLLQQTIRRFYAGIATNIDWSNAISDVQLALTSTGYVELLQAVVFLRNETGSSNRILNVTIPEAQEIKLPYNENGVAIMLGDEGLGFPPALYPNLTYVPTTEPDPADASTNLTQVYASPGLALNATSQLLLGPLQVNKTYSILSITLPIINKGTTSDILGYMTIVASAASFLNALASREGLDSTGISLLLGPANFYNQFPGGEGPTALDDNSGANKTALESAQVKFCFEPTLSIDQISRHNLYNGPFPLAYYPAALNILSASNLATQNGSSQLETTNEQGSSVAVGVARLQVSIVDWVLIIEQAHYEAFAPVIQLRNILLACVLGTVGLVALLVIPLAHFSVLPIRRLKEATEKSIQPPGMTIRSEGSQSPDESRDPSSNEGYFVRMLKLAGRLFASINLFNAKGGRPTGNSDEDEDRRAFKIPGKVKQGKHFIKDELTELTSTFNEMSTELVAQYVKLEERVAERTQELEISKRNAEAANETKTLFLANISHELKTPLNGILGLCAVCLGEDNLPQIKSSLQVIYKSGDLLLHLLNDLLTFSTNQMGQPLRLDEGEFSLAVIGSQVANIFAKQIQEGHISFCVNFIDFGNNEPKIEEPSHESNGAAELVAATPGTSKLEEMILWGDQHRILQILINLVNNSLKFTPEGGTVELRIMNKGKVRGPSEMELPESKRSPQESQHPNRNELSHTYTHLSNQSTICTPSDENSLCLEFEVEDTGPGIPVHLLQRVFEPFVQGEIGLMRKYGGTGLGLSICSQLTALMGGTITLKSTVGVGTTFTVRIPVKVMKEKPSSMISHYPSTPSGPSMSSTDASPLGASLNSSGSPSNSVRPHRSSEQKQQPKFDILSQPFQSASLPSKPESGALDEASQPLSVKSRALNEVRVLIAEDNLVNQEVLVRMLKLENISDITIANDGQEAYDIVKTSMDRGTVYNLIIMDVQMPNLDGLQSTRLIRQLGYTAPIIASTAYTEESSIENCIDSGMDMFLSKPIRRPALRNVIRNYIPTLDVCDSPS